MTADRVSLGRAAIDILWYAAARLLLLIVLAAAIYWLGLLLGLDDFPPIVAVLLALVVSLPLGMWVFRPLRRRATASMALLGERRRQDREQLQARLRGAAVPGEGLDDE
ncbi:MAG: DUF4229 domain-containing protein [Mycobacterium sp.]